MQFIQTSPELALILAKQNKQIHLLDPKTMSILYKYADQTYVTKPIAYSNEYQQFLSSQSIKTLINVWNSDSELPHMKISFAERITYLQFQQSNSVLIGGTQNGTILLWEIPSGLLLKKFVGHNRKIIYIGINQDFSIITSTSTEIKLWHLINILGNQENCDIKQSNILNYKEQIIDVIITEDRVFILSLKATSVYKLYNFEKQQSFELQNSTCFATNKQKSHLYVGNKNANIYEYRVHKNIEYRQISYENQILNIKKTPKERVFKGHKNAISCIAYINSTKYVISGTPEGELIVWQNGQIKRQIKLFRTEIIQIKIIQRPHKFKGNPKKSDKLKIQTLHKYENNNENEPIWFINDQKKPVEEEDIEQIYDKMTAALFNEKELMKSEIENLKNQNQQLLKYNQHYANIFLNKFN